MPRARCVIDNLIAGRAQLVVSSKTTGQRYVFTRKQREVEIDEADVDMFVAKTIKISECGCTGGKRAHGNSVHVFEVIGG